MRRLNDRHFPVSDFIYNMLSRNLRTQEVRPIDRADRRARSGICVMAARPGEQRAARYLKRVCKTRREHEAASMEGPGASPRRVPRPSRAAYDHRITRAMSSLTQDVIVGIAAARTARLACLCAFDSDDPDARRGHRRLIPPSAVITSTRPAAVTRDGVDSACCRSNPSGQRRGAPTHCAHPERCGSCVRRCAEAAAGALHLNTSAIADSDLQPSTASAICPVTGRPASDPPPPNRARPSAASRDSVPSKVRSSPKVRSLPGKFAMRHVASTSSAAQAISQQLGSCFVKVSERGIRPNMERSTALLEDQYSHRGRPDAPGFFASRQPDHGAYVAPSALPLVGNFHPILDEALRPWG